MYIRVAIVNLSEHFKRNKYIFVNKFSCREMMQKEVHGRMRAELFGHTAPTF